MHYDVPHIDIAMLNRSIRLPTNLLDRNAKESLRLGLLVLSNPSVQLSLGSEYNTVRRLISSLPPVPSSFHQALEACQCLRDNPYAWPSLPADFDKSKDNQALLHWMYTAFSHICKHWAKLEALCGTHAEGFSDVNLWSVLLDFAFLNSTSITCDRKELSAGITDISYKHDGIIRGTHPVVVGLIEAKPLRPTRLVKSKLIDDLDYVKDDYSKIVYSLSQMLFKLENPQLVLTGIICKGFDLTIIRGQWFGNVCLFNEFHQNVNLTTLDNVLTLCWKLKLGCEEANALLKQTKIFSDLDDI